MSEQEKKDIQKEESEVPKEINEAKELKAELGKAIKERDEYLDGWRRAKADLANYKKEELKRLEEIARFSNEEIIKDLITVLDSFELAMAALERMEGKIEKGVYMIKNQLEDLLRRKGLSKIKVSVNEDFNPLYHDAVGIIEKEGGKAGMIAEEVGTGYIFHNKVLRPTRVKLFK